VDANRLEVMAGLTRRMLDRAHRRIEFRTGTDLQPLVEGADFVVCQIRVGGMDARHLDETLPLKYGTIGPKTTGPGGMFQALRTIPHMLPRRRSS
jgi:6-phospho-beta-glucosidase